MDHALSMGSDDTLAEASRLDDEGYAAFQSGDHERAEQLHTEGLRLARSVGDAGAIVLALTGLMRVALRTGSWERLSELSEDAERTARAAGDDALLRMPLHMRAEAARMRGELEEARHGYSDSISLNEALGSDSMVGVERGNLAWVEIAAGDLEEAQRLVDLCAQSTAEDDSYGTAFVQLTRGRILLERDDPTGVALVDSADRTLSSAGLVWDPAEQRCYEQTRALAERHR